MSAAAQAAVRGADNPAGLPRLREDLRLIDQTAGGGVTGHRLIYDPLRHRYVRIDAECVDILSLWHAHDQAEALAEAVNARYARSIDGRQVLEFAEFLVRSELTASDAGWRELWQRRERQRQHWLMRIVHSYLFFRVPLMSPERLITASLPLIKPLMSRRVVGVIGFLGLVGLYLVSRQWDAFLGTFHHVFTPAGALMMALVVCLVKALHECGHAYVAASLGCRVPTVGIAFMVMVPMLYTDVTDAWRLPDRRSRMAIDAAGILVEVGLACLALFLWPFLPEGPGKTAAFMTATASLIMTLGLNLNPFMRFDGYYLLADLWGVENLQPRAFAVGRWKLREVVFGPGEARPEPLTTRKERLLVAYAWATWLYRLITFTGIALLVYHMFFKALGIVLFLVEIVFFIALPIAREAATWWGNRAVLRRTRRAGLSAVVLALSIAAIAMPWSTRVVIPAVIEWRDPVRLFPVRAARIASVHGSQGQTVDVGALVVTLEVPELAAQIRQAQTRLNVTQLRLARRMADDQDRDQSLILEDESRSLQTRLQGLQTENALLQMRAPFAGQLLEMNPALQPGRWISKTEPIALVGKPGQWILRGYISESDLWRVGAGARGRFIAHESSLPSIAVALAEVARAGAQAIDTPELMSLHGGAIAVEGDRGNRQAPVSAQYLATLSPLEVMPPLDRVVRGTVVLQGAAESYASSAWRQISAIVIRESGF